MSLTVWHVGGGDVRFRIPLLHALRQAGFRVGAVGSEDPAPFEAAGISYWRYPLRRGPSPIGDLLAWRRLHALFSEHAPDVVHAFDTKPTYLVPSAAQRAGVAGRVCTITGMGYLFSTGTPIARILRPAYRLLQRRACHASSATIFQNEDDLRWFVDHGVVPARRARLVRGSGIDLDDLHARRPDPARADRLREELGIRGRRVVIMISRLVYQKGVMEFLEAATRVRRNHPEVVFLLVGSASDAARGAVPLAVVRRHGKDVTYLGARKDVPALLFLSDICVLPSYYREGVPRALLEGGAMGLPLIATDMPGCRDVVKDGWNGLLVRERDAGALAEGIERLLGSEDLRRMMGERARRRVEEEFSLASVAAAYAAIYREAVAGETLVDGGPAAGSADAPRFTG